MKLMYTAVTQVIKRYNYYAKLNLELISWG